MVKEFIKSITSRQAYTKATKSGVKDGQQAVLLKTIKTVGVITGIEEKFNSRGRVCFYYNVKWPDGRTSEHAQHILVPAP